MREGWPSLLYGSLTSAVATEHPVVVRANVQQDRRITEAPRAEIFDRVPVLPDRGLCECQRGCRSFAVEGMEFRQNRRRPFLRRNGASIEGRAFGTFDVLFPVHFAIDFPFGFVGFKIGNSEERNQSESGQVFQFHDPIRKIDLSSSILPRHYPITIRPSAARRLS